MRIVCLCKLLVSVGLIVPLLSGCWDQMEIEERTSVVAIAIDKSEEHPEMLQVSIQIPIPVKIANAAGGGASGAGEAVKIMSSTGRTVVEGFNNLQKRLNQELFYGHTRIIAIGEAVAKEGLDDIIDGFRRAPQIRRLLWPFVVKGRGVDLLRANPELEQIPTVFIMSMIKYGAQVGRIPDQNLGKFFSDLSSKSREPYLNYMEVNENDIKWSGIAVFRGDRMVGILNEREAWECIRISDKQDGGFIVFEYEGNPKQLVTLRTEFIKASKHYAYRDGKAILRIHMYMEADLLERTFETDFSKPDLLKQLERDAETFLEQGSVRTLEKLQNTYRSDILGIGRKIKAYHPDIWKKLDWQRDFPNADIKVYYDLKIRRTGMEIG